MPSPDVSNYVDLTLFDLSSQQIYLKALEYARIALPEYQPVEGSIETVLLQAMALEVQDLVTSINRLPGGIVQALLGIIGVPRAEATASSGLMKLTAVSNADVTISAGVRLFYRTTALDDPIVVATEHAITLSVNRQLYSVAISGTTMTVTTSVRHGFSAGDEVTISSVESSMTDYIGDYTVLSSPAPTATTFAVTLGASSSGTIALSSTQSSVAFTAPTTDAYGYAYVTALKTGYQYVADGNEFLLLTSEPSIAVATLVEALDGGIDTETDTAYFQRASSTLGRMTAALVTSEQISQYLASASNFGYLYRVKAVDNCGADRAVGAAGSALVVGARIGATTSIQLTSGQLTDIETELAGRSHPALEISADNAMLGIINVSATVHVANNFTATQVETACTTALAAYLNPDTWAWDPVVRHNELIHVLRNASYNGVPAVAYVTDVEVGLAGANLDSLATPYGLHLETGASRTSNVVTVLCADDHNLTTQDYVALKLGAETTYTLYRIASVPASDSFTVSQTGSNAGPLGATWFPVARVADAVGESGDLTFYDPAPLVLSGSHTIYTS